MSALKMKNVLPYLNEHTPVFILDLDSGARFNIQEKIR